ncbi:lycopene cyclase domain-containing protein [Demequina capsici]|uniref:Lycopene cyclase domain-containing protein n=1 Tax=Demequina capsici TaxID=3075620 RepID=A0AA96FAW8_9MICO|nr:lycopene cyclase domain-containing protein [Demequina sp. PMTSA13]WNM27381.1 lycopene cyclase domain-containing protein [Demequina sp. PMTSA13]
MSLTYLAALAISIGGLAVLDRRLRLALFVQPARTMVTVAGAVVVFLAWDALGVGRGIFFIGDAPYLTGVRLAPQIPVEELLFLVLLTYQTLLLWRWFSRSRDARTRSAPDDGPPGGTSRAVDA